MGVMHHPAVELPDRPGDDGPTVSAVALYISLQSAAAITHWVPPHRRRHVPCIVDQYKGLNMLPTNLGVMPRHRSSNTGVDRTPQAKKTSVRPFDAWQSFGQSTSWVIGFWLPGIIALAAVGGGLAISGSAISPAAAAAVVTPHGMLREGNGLLNIGFTAGAAAGPAIAGRSWPGYPNGAVR